MVRRVVTHSNLNNPRNTNQQGTVRSEPRQLVADHDFGSDHASWYVVAIFANRAMAGLGSSAISVLALLANHAPLVCRANTSGKGVAGSQELDLKTDNSAMRPSPVSYVRMRHLFLTPERFASSAAAAARN
jgi:hypothetical protein